MTRTQGRRLIVGHCFFTACIPIGINSSNEVPREEDARLTTNPDDPNDPIPKPPAFDPDRPGVNDFVAPFVFVPHGTPDPVAFKKAHPG